MILSIEVVPAIRDKGYPKLRRNVNDGTIILFSSRDSGTVVFTNTRSCIGYFSRNWNPNEFEDYAGSISLEND